MQNCIIIIVRNLHFLIKIMEELTKKVEKACPNKGRKKISQPDLWKKQIEGKKLVKVTNSPPNLFLNYLTIYVSVYVFFFTHKNTYIRVLNKLELHSLVD